MPRLLAITIAKMNYEMYFVTATARLSILNLVLALLAIPGLTFMIMLYLFCSSTAGIWRLLHFF